MIHHSGKLVFHRVLKPGRNYFGSSHLEGGEALLFRSLEKLGLLPNHVSIYVMTAGRPNCGSPFLEVIKGQASCQIHLTNVNLWT